MIDVLDNLNIEGPEHTVLVGQTNNILVVDDEELIHQVLERILKNSGYILDFATSGEDALQKVRKKEYNLLIVDKNLPGISGIEVMENARSFQPDLEFIVITAYASYRSAVEALRLGAFDYVEKPFNDLKLLKEKIRRALARQHLIRENQVLYDHLRDAHKDLKGIQEKIRRALARQHLSGENQVLYDHLHNAHKDLKGTIEALGKSLGGVEKISLYLRSAINKSTRELKIHNAELKQAISGASAPLKQARDKLKNEEEEPTVVKIRETRDLLARTWDILASRVGSKPKDR